MVGTFDSVMEGVGVAFVVIKVFVEGYFCAAEERGIFLKVFQLFRAYFKVSHDLLVGRLLAFFFNVIGNVFVVLA